MNINELIDIAIENGFEDQSNDRSSFIKKEECVTLVYDTDYSVRGDHSYDAVEYYLVCSEKTQRAFLCYTASIIEFIPDDIHVGYVEWLKKAASIATKVSGIEVFIPDDIYVGYSSTPLAFEITQTEEVCDISWFVRAVMAYQTVIEFMTEGYFRRDKIIEKP